MWSKTQGQVSSAAASTSLSSNTVTGEQSTSGGSKHKIKWQGDGWEERGGYMAAKKQKLAEQFLDKRSSMGDIKSNIFYGVVIHVDGYTKPSSDELKRIMYQHGGKYEHYLAKRKVTHIIATSLPDSKIKKDFKHCKVVKPEWITDSVAAGRLLSYIPYQLYTAQSKIQQGMTSYGSFSTKKVSHTNVSETCRSNTTFCQNLIDSSVRAGSTDRNEVDSYGNLAINDEKYESGSEVSEEDGGNSDEYDNDFNTLVKEQKQTVLDDQVSNTSICNTSLNLADQSKNFLKKSPAKAGDPQYLNEFYSNSRLHHLSTWKSEWRAYVNKLQSEPTDFPGRKALLKLVSENIEKCATRTVNEGGHVNRTTGQRVIMHIDMDCFFVSVGLRKRPDLKGKPVAVTHSKGQGTKGPLPGSDYEYEKKHWRGGSENTTQTRALDGTDPTKLDLSQTFTSMAEIASCSYEARQAGVKNGMFMGQARKLCPGLQTIPYDFQGYQEVSKILYDTVASYTHDIEAVSCDEMLVDCTDLLTTTGAQPVQFASLLREQIYSKTGCTASAGMGSNILLAKMATRKAKPNGQFHLDSSTNVLEFMRDQSVQNIPGVGWSLAKRLKLMNVATCGQLQKLSLNVLQKDFGPKTGQSLYNCCRGQDDRPIKMDQERKSVSAEINYGIRFKRDTEADRFILDLSEEVHNRLQTIQKKGKYVSLKLMVRREDAPMETSKFMGHGICNNVCKSTVLPIATDEASIIHQECMTILRGLRLNCSDLRGIGIQVQRLEPAVVGQKSTKGAQSILNFTVNKKVTEQSPQNPKPCNITINKTTNKEKTVSPVKVSPTEKRHWTDTLLELDNELNSPDKPSNVVSSGLDVQLKNAFCSSESDSIKDTDTENASFLEGAICQNLVQELSRRKTANRFLPPLPTLDIPSTPEYKHLMKRTENTETTVSSSQPVDYFPSPSQIDHRVLQELPPDIREQVENEMKTRKRDQRKTRQRVSYSEDPGCSHWSDAEIPGERVQKDSIVPLPDLSQLDESCLSALPEDMQQEIRAAYEFQQNVNKQLKKPKSPGKSSPNKSPGKARKNSPQFKVPQGKPRKGKPKKLDFKKSQPRIDNAVAARKQSETDIDPKLPGRVIEEDNMVDLSHKYVQELTAPAESKQVPEQVNLCGAVSITDVRKLLREWISSSSEPEKDDEEVMITYLKELILDRNLEQVDLVIKFLNRNVEHLGCFLWETSLKRILSEVQQFMKMYHGAALKIC